MIAAFSYKKKPSTCMIAAFSYKKKPSTCMITAFSHKKKPSTCMIAAFSYKKKPSAYGAHRIGSCVQLSVITIIDSESIGIIDGRGPNVCWGIGKIKAPPFMFG